MVFINEQAGKSFKKLLTSLKVGYFLGFREIKRANPWTNILIVFIMTVTFLNLIVVRGILVGLTEGSVQSYRDRYTGNVFLTPPDQEQYIKESHMPIGLSKDLSLVQAVSPRYIGTALIEAEYKNPTGREEDKDQARGIIAGINPTSEDAVTGLSKLLIKGEYLDPEKENQILVGSSLLQKYGLATGNEQSLKNADVGTTVRLTVNGVIKEVKIVGVLKAKVTTIDSRIFMLDRQLRPMLGRDDFNVGEIAIKSKDPTKDELLRSIFLGNGIDKTATVKTWQEAQPQFVKDIAATFAVLSNVIGSIGLSVACITIFIVIFVNAITKRKYIGILKGIGVSPLAIESSYIFQSLFYAVAGSLIGLALVYGVIVPYFASRPIDFPFSDGIFVADIPGVLLRVVILLISTMIAGFIPARIVVKQKTLDAILGR